MGSVPCDKARIERYNETVNPLVPCNPFALWDAEKAKGLCGPCKVAAQTTHNTGRQAIWDQLPGVFRLPDWDELKAKWSTVSQLYDGLTFLF